MKQWPAEVAKFTGADALRVVCVRTVGDLSGLTIAKLEAADIVVVAATVFRSDLYFQRLAALAGGGELPGKGGRLFDAIYEENLERLKARVDLLKEKGTEGVKELLAEDAARRKDASATALVVDTKLGTTAKRLMTKKAVYAAEKAAARGGAAAAAGKKRKSPDGAAAAADAAASDNEETASKTESAEGGTEGESAADKAAPVKRSVGDPWGLARIAREKRADVWRELASPPLEMFSWARVVVDEFTYLNERDRSAVQGMTAVHRWCLSGTPPVGSFDDIRGVAAFLGVHLGADEVPALKKEQTKAEKFRFFQEMHTPAWHLRRHLRAQAFMDRFVRQNIAEIDEIKAEEHVVPITLPPAERAIYLELDHHLQAMDMKSKKTIKSAKDVADGDREARLRSVLGASGSAEEALLKRCAHFDLEDNAKSAQAACEAIVALREGQRAECVAELKKVLAETYAMRAIVVKRLDKHYAQDKEEPLNRWHAALELTGDEGCGDADAAATLRKIAAEGKKLHAGGKKQAGGDGDGGSGDEDGGAKKPKKKKLALREHVHTLRRLERELVGRERSLRYFRAVRDLQQGAPAARDICCPACARRPVPAADAAVLSCCGHVGCGACLAARADRQECPVHGCNAPARAASVIAARVLGADDSVGGSSGGASAHRAGGKYGSKLTAVIEKIRGIPEGDRVLVFVQFPDLMQCVAEALQDADIAALQLRGSVHQKTAALEVLQKEAPEKGDARVLLLNLKDESASGANLTTANHAIFVHPLLAASQQEYTACETQAIGRIRRYGQNKTVFIWRYLAADTIDTTIYEDRTRKWDDGMKSALEATATVTDAMDVDSADAAARDASPIA
ncbi:hypothetical protein JKP88DRAFT_204605 [Tribonema minus]|uniref:RING-type domain-containing protein n=1 Tax=Tribonema minus TaxID=303371 RepID=A0A836CM92_9STRA|nr:hypothetical protein JKP88DRAFT_204605 [Tribonema minus]